jgi:hypothetical protein
MDNPNITESGVPLGKVSPLDLKNFISSPITISPSAKDNSSSKTKPKNKLKSKLEELIDRKSVV